MPVEERQPEPHAPVASPSCPADSPARSTVSMHELLASCAAADAVSKPPSDAPGSTARPTAPAPSGGRPLPERDAA